MKYPFILAGLVVSGYIIFSPYQADAILERNFWIGKCTEKDWTKETNANALKRARVAGDKSAEKYYANCVAVLGGEK